MDFNILINAMATETIIGIVAVIAIVLSVLAIVLTSIRNYSKAKKTAKVLQDIKTTDNAHNNDNASANTANIVDAESAPIAKAVEAVAEQTIDTAIVEIVDNSTAVETAVVEEVVAENAAVEEVVAENAAVEEVINDVQMAEPIVEQVVEPITEQVAEYTVVKGQADDVVASTITAEQAVEVATNKESEDNAIAEFDNELTAFEMNLIDAGAETISLYNDLMNSLLSFVNARNSVSTNFDTYKVNKDIIARIIFVNKKLTVCLPIDPNDARFSEKKYAHDDLSKNGTYAKVPFAITIRCGLNVRRCMELFDSEVVSKYQLVRNDNYVMVNYVDKYIKMIK